jgi:hypothetical protein
MLAAAHLAVDPGRNEAAGDQWAQQQMIDAQSGVAAKRVPEIFSSARRADSEPSCHVAAHIPGNMPPARSNRMRRLIYANRWDKTLASQAGSASTPRSPRRQAACRARGRRSPGLSRPGARSPPGRAFPRGSDARPRPRRSTACGPGRGARTVSNAACSSCAGHRSVFNRARSRAGVPRSQSLPTLNVTCQKRLCVFWPSSRNWPSPSVMRNAIRIMMF